MKGTTNATSGKPITITFTIPNSAWVNRTAIMTVAGLSQIQTPTIGVDYSVMTSDQRFQSYVAGICAPSRDGDNITFRMDGTVPTLFPDGIPCIAFGYAGISTTTVISAMNPHPDPKFRIMVEVSNDSGGVEGVEVYDGSTYIGSTVGFLGRLTVPAGRGETHTINLEKTGCSFTFPNGNVVVCNSLTTFVYAKCVIGPQLNITVSNTTGLTLGDTELVVTNGKGYNQVMPVQAPESIQIPITGKLLMFIRSANTKLISNRVLLNASEGGTYNVAFSFSPIPAHKLSFNATTFKTDSTGCFTYAGASAGYTPLVAESVKVLSRRNPGSWVFDTEPLMSRMFYATFTDDGKISCILNPDNLNEDIFGQPSDVEVNNTMLVVPRMAILRNASGLELGTGETHAFDLNGAPYNYIAYGVYGGYIQNGKLRSISGVLPTTSTTLAQFRAAAFNVNPPSKNWRIMNYHQHCLYRDLVYFITKSFDSKACVGFGGPYNTSPTIETGLCNEYGPFAGRDEKPNFQYKNQVKCLIENPWGAMGEMMDDVVYSNGTLYVGTNQTPDNNTANMIAITGTSRTTLTSSTNILQTQLGWGVSTGNESGTGGLKNVQAFTSGTNMIVGRGGNASGSRQGVSALYPWVSTMSDPGIGSRLVLMLNELKFSWEN